MRAVEEFLRQEKIKFSLAELWVNSTQQRLSSLCYLEKQGRILLLQRNKEPFTGFWTAPGGKLEIGENPRETIIREVREETGLTIINPRLQLIVAETGPDSAYNWLVFMFRCQQFTGKMFESSNEGNLNWVPREQLAEIEITTVDRYLLQDIFAEQRYYIQLTYDEQHQVKTTTKSPL